MNDLRFHVYDDMDTLGKSCRVPSVFFNYFNCYIMQENRTVFVGRKEQATAWMKVNKNKKIENFYPDQTAKNNEIFTHQPLACLRVGD